MAIKSSNQCTLIDISDGYSCNATLDSHVLSGTTTGVNGTQSVTSTYSMTCGRETKACSVDVSEITKPTGVTITSDGKSPSPSLTFTFSSAVTTGGTIDIPVYCASDDITIVKTFSYSISYKGETGNGITSTEVKYAKSTSGTTPPATGWQDHIPSTVAGEFCWTMVKTEYSVGDPTISYSVAYTAANGTSVTVQSTTIEYAITSSATPPTTGWSTTKPTSIPQGQYQHIKTKIVFSDNKTAEYTSTSYQGVDGQDGAKGDDAITLSIMSSNGLIFRNSQISTVLTCEVFKGGKKLNSDEIAAEGTIKWYKLGSNTPVGTGITYTVSATDVFGSENFVVQLEG